MPYYIAMPIALNGIPMSRLVCRVTRTAYKTAKSDKDKENICGSGIELPTSGMGALSPKSSLRRTRAR
jgi:hypothetical protein